MDLYSSVKSFQLLLESETSENMFKPSTIIDFYLVSYLDDVVNEEDKQILKDEIYQIRNIYLESFKQILRNQIQKYISRGRLVKEYSRDEVLDADYPKLFEMIQSSRRSDMKRKNKNWNMLAEYLVKLYKQRRDVDEIKMLIDRINNTVHNTGTSMLTKFKNKHDLLEALNLAAEAKIQDLIRNSRNRSIKNLAKEYRYLYQ